MHKYKNWFLVNKLTLNLNKTNFQLYTNSKNITTPKIELENTPITRSFQVKFLGLNKDETLKWKLHIDAICKKYVIQYRHNSSYQTLIN